MSDYPKWVSRSPEVGAVLCLNEAEEKQLWDNWNAALLKEAEEATAAAKAEAEAAKEFATVTLKKRASA